MHTIAWKPRKTIMMRERSQTKEKYIWSYLYKTQKMQTNVSGKNGAVGGAWGQCQGGTGGYRKLGG